jgi:predicted transposase YbfD/YdcC
MSLPLASDVLSDLKDLEPTLDASILTHFLSLPDFRRDHGKRHLLLDIVVLTLFGLLSDCDTWVDIEQYGRDKYAWLRSFLLLPNGIPSHDTIRRVFLLLDPVAFQRCSLSWMSALYDKCLRHKEQLLAGQLLDGLTPSQPPASQLPVLQTAASDATAAPLVEQLDDSLPRQVTLSPTLPQAVFAPRSAAVEPTRHSSQIAATQAATQEQLALRPSARQTEQQLPQPANTQPDRRQQPSTQTASADAAQQSGQQPQIETNELVTTKAKQEPAERLRHLAVDGKALRRSHDRTAAQPALHLVSVWEAEFGLTLGQVAVRDKSNEITAIPEVLKLVDLQGAVVSIDAIGTQEAIVNQVRDGGGDYLLAVKENQPHLYEDVLASFDQHFSKCDGKAEGNVYETSESGHGRKEKRRYIVLDDVSAITDKEKWRDVQSLIMVYRECEKADGKREEESRFFIGSATASAKDYATWIRGHWGIENKLHWVLDVIFREDESRVRKGNGTRNLALLRRIAVSLLGNEKATKLSIRCKRKKAARDNSYLLGVLLGLKDIASQDPSACLPQLSPLGRTTRAVPGK